MSKHEVWFAIPSANPENCRRTLPVWREMGYKVAVLQNRERAEIPADIVAWADAYPGWGASINVLARSIVPRSAPIIVSGGDDMLPDPHKSAASIAEDFLNHFADAPGGTFGVMQPHGDAFADTRAFCGSPWLGRAWMDSMYAGSGGMCGAYRHHFADDELYWVSKAWGALWLRPDLCQAHEHFLRRGEKPPEYWSTNVRPHLGTDTRLFIDRVRSGFPGHHPLLTPAGRGFDASLIAREYTQRAERLWDRDHGEEWTGLADERMAAALERCRRRGLTRVVLVGAGRHTHRLTKALRSPPVAVLAIVDDNPALAGTRVWNYPVVSLETAAALEPDAVVLSSDAHEDVLARAAEPLAAAGAVIIRLYAPGAEALTQAQ